MMTVYDEWLVGVVHEHGEREWEACDWGFGFNDVNVEGCGRKFE